MISTPKRPVPLEHYLYTGNSNKTSNEQFLIVNNEGKFLTRGYQAAVDAKKERASKSKDAFGAKGARFSANPKQVSKTLIRILFYYKIIGTDRSFQDKMQYILMFWEKESFTFLVNIFQHPCTGIFGTVSKISALQPEGPRFVPALPRFESLCDLLFHLSQLSFPSFRGR